MKEVLLTYSVKDPKTGELRPQFRWWPEYLLSKVPANVQVTSQTRMGYAPPAWLPKEENPNGCILLLDDYTRANSLPGEVIYYF